MFKLFLLFGALVFGQKNALTRQQPQQQQQQQQCVAPLNKAADKVGRIAGGGIISANPTPASGQMFLDIDDAVLLLLDHQTGLFQTVRDITIAQLRTNVLALTKVAKLADIPIIITASEPNGPNGPLMEELYDLNLTYVARKGEISAWDNADIVKAVKDTGRKTLIIAGVWTSICVAFPALQARADGYRVYTVHDASGDLSEATAKPTLVRLGAAGVHTVTTNTIVCEIQRTWNRPDANAYFELFTSFSPEYKALVESYDRAQAAAKGLSPSAAPPKK